MVSSGYSDCRTVSVLASYFYKVRWHDPYKNTLKFFTRLFSKRIILYRVAKTKILLTEEIIAGIF